MKLPETLKLVSQLFADEIKASMAATGLADSRLQQSVVGGVEGNDTITINMNEYGQWVISGRKPGTKKVPIAALLQWIKDKRIQSDLPDIRLAFAIQNSIYLTGIRGRDFLTGTIEGSLETASELIVEELYTEFETQLQKEFGNGK